MTSTSPSVSAIIVNWNTRDHLLNCVRTLLAGTGSTDMEILVIDNASSDGSADAIGGEFPGIRLFANRDNLMFAGGVNQGWKNALGRYFLVLNPDVIITHAAVAGLAKYLDAHPSVAGVSPLLYYPNGALQSEFYPHLPTLTQVLLFYTFLSRFSLKNRWLRRKYFECDLGKGSEASIEQLPGACMLVRRSAVETIGLMDEDFILYYEDADWCKRLRPRGEQVVVKTISALHHGGGSHEKRESWLFGRFRVSMLLYFRKHLGHARYRILLVFFWTNASLGLAIRLLQRESRLFNAAEVGYHIEKYRFFFEEYRTRRASIEKY